MIITLKVRGKVRFDIKLLNIFLKIINLNNGNDYYIYNLVSTYCVLETS